MSKLTLILMVLAGLIGCAKGTPATPGLPSIAVFGEPIESYKMDALKTSLPDANYTYLNQEGQEIPDSLVPTTSYYLVLLTTGLGELRNPATTSTQYATNLRALLVQLKTQGLYVKFVTQSGFTDTARETEFNQAALTVMQEQNIEVLELDQITADARIDAIVAFVTEEL